MAADANRESPEGALPRPSGPEFPPATQAAWRELAERELKGGSARRLTTHTPEGLELAPLVTAEDAGPAVPRAPLVARPGHGWTIAQEYRQTDPRAAGAAAGIDLSHGTEAAWFVVDEAIAAGVGDEPPVGRAGVALGGADDLAAMLAEVDLAAVEVTIDAGLQALKVARLVAAEAERRGVALTRLRGAIVGDPLALLVATGRIGWPLKHVYRDMAELTGWAAAAAPGLRTVLVDASVWHEAGATAADEIAGMLAAALEHLRGLGRAGVARSAAAEAMVFVLTVGRDLPLELAKLRAARSLWARVATACEIGPKGQMMKLHARASRRELSALDPWVNLIRATTEGITAALAGADSVALPAFDEPLGEPSPLGGRMARNTQLILRDEAHLGVVQDPAGGSHAIEQATEALARAAWLRLQQIEGEGGLVASLQAGAVQGRVQQAAQAQAQKVATLRLPIVGASRFAARPLGPALTARPGAREPAVLNIMSDRAWSQGHALEDMAGERVTALVRGRLSEPFEALRARGAALGEPRVALVAVGTAGEVRPRVEFARSYFPIGGFSVVETEATVDVAEAVRRFAATGAQVAVICGTDAGYADFIASKNEGALALVPGLRAAGARAVVLAGRPKDQVEALAAAGVDVFIAAGGDALATLGAVQQRLEVVA